MLGMNDLKPGHFYQSSSKNDTKDIFIYITNDQYQDWIGKYGESDDAHVIYKYTIVENNRNYKELSTNLPVFSKIGQYIIKRIFK